MKIYYPGHQWNGLQSHDFYNITEQKQICINSYSPLKKTTTIISTTETTFQIKIVLLTLSAFRGAGVWGLDEKGKGIKQKKKNDS